VSFACPRLDESGRWVSSGIRQVPNASRTPGNVDEAGGASGVFYSISSHVSIVPGLSLRSAP
jgi:hypothetical protein